MSAVISLKPFFSQWPKWKMIVDEFASTPQISCIAWIRLATFETLKSSFDAMNVAMIADASSVMSMHKSTRTTRSRNCSTYIRRVCTFAVRTIRQCGARVRCNRLLDSNWKSTNLHSTEEGKDQVKEPSETSATMEKKRIKKKRKSN